MPLESENFIGLFDTEEETLPDLPVASPLESARGNGGNGTPASLESKASDDDWRNDPVPVKLEKIRAAFLNAKRPGEVMAMAGTMAMAEWLELVIKLSPKNVQVSGGISFRHMLEELGPINKEQYRLSGPVIEAELA